VEGVNLPQLLLLALLLLVPLLNAVARWLRGRLEEAARQQQQPAPRPEDQATAGRQEETRPRARDRMAARGREEVAAHRPQRAADRRPGPRERGAGQEEALPPLPPRVRLERASAARPARPPAAGPAPRAPRVARRAARITAADARRAIVMVTVLGPCPGLRSSPDAGHSHPGAER
jgi:hypothetical protein